MPKSGIQDSLAAHMSAVEGFIQQHGSTLEQLADKLADAFRGGNKLLVCGNGGSACDAMHIAGEFVGRFVNDRVALPAIALSADSGILSAVGNDYGYEQVFSRQVEAYGNKGDVLIALSTSGSSANVVKALAAAKSRGLVTALLTGEKGKGQSSVADVLLVVPSMNTARVQEVHLFALHLLAEQVEAKMGLDR